MTERIYHECTKYGHSTSIAMFYNKLKHVIFLIQVILLTSYFYTPSDSIVKLVLGIFISNRNIDATIQCLFITLYLFYLSLAIFSCRLNILFPDSFRDYISTRAFWIKIAWFYFMLFSIQWKGIGSSKWFLLLGNYALCISSIFYTFVQSVTFIDIMYKWNSMWVKKDKPLYYSLLLIFSAVFIIFSVTLALILIFFYANSYVKELLIGSSILFALLYIPLSIYLDDASLFVSAGIFIYSMFLCYIAITSDRPNIDSTKPMSSFSYILLWLDLRLQYITNQFFGLLFLIYCCLFLDQNFKRLLLLVMGDDEDASFEENSNFAIFHLFMALNTSFIYVVRYGDSVLEYISFLSKSAMLLFTIFLYLWALIAPFVRKDKYD